MKDIIDKRLEAVRKSDEAFAAMLDGYHTGGYVTRPEPLVVNTLDDAREMIERYHVAFPHMGSRENPLVLHITVQDDMTSAFDEVARRWGGPGIGWGDAAADPLADLKAMRDAAFASSVSPKRFIVSKRIANKIARRTMSKRAYRRWRGRNR